MAAKKFTRLPKIQTLIETGVPTESIPTFYALCDHARNDSGECWPSMARLAQILGKSVRTIQRHLQALKEAGVVEFVERRRNKGRYSSYLYRVVFFTLTTGHGRRMGKRGPINKGTRRTTNAPQSPPREDFNGWLGLPSDYKRQQEPRRERRREDYRWFFGG